MSRRFLAALALGLLPGWTWAQGGGPGEGGGDLVASAIQAYQRLEFDVAAGLLRRALAPPVADSLDDDKRAEALTYLGATERYRERRDSAVAVFRRLVLLYPRHRIDPLVFAPEVTGLFEDIRSRTKTVAIRLPTDTAIALGGRLVAWLHASSPHDVAVGVAREDGRPLRVLYDGPIGDSIDVRWDGRNEEGTVVSGARVWLTVASRGGDASRLVQVPLHVELARADTIPHPPPLSSAQLLPERADGGTARRSLASGLVLGAAAVALPQIIAPRERSGGTRFLVAGVLGVGGLVGYLSQPPGRPLPANAAANQVRREQWQRRVDAVTRENADRRRAARLQIRADRPVTIDRGRSAQ